MWYQEIWGKFRFFLVEMSTDFLILIFGYILLTAANRIEKDFHLTGEAARYADYLHQGVLYAATTIWLIWTVIDMWHIRRALRFSETQR